MAGYRGAGFTIIEVMLFLAVSGLLTVGILAGTSVAIAAQRYRDAVSTLQSDIQQQYEDVVSVKNERNTTPEAGCGTGGEGRSNCVLLGKFMTLAANGTEVQYRVYGVEPSGATVPTNEHDAIKQYAPVITTIGSQDTEMEWSTTPGQPVGAPASTGIGILVIRSPQSGSTFTFVRNGTATNNLDTMINPANTARRTICVVPNGWSVADLEAVIIGANAASAGAIERKSNQMLTQEGGERC